VALDQACTRCGAAVAIYAQKIDAFARLMNDKLDAGDTNTRKGYICSIINAVEVGDQTIRIIGSKDVLQAAIASKQTDNGNVRGLVRKWRAISHQPPKLLASDVDNPHGLLAEGSYQIVYEATDPNRGMRTPPRVTQALRIEFGPEPSLPQPA
jgi:hypothetical protein